MTVLPRNHRSKYLISASLADIIAFRVGIESTSNFLYTSRDFV